MLQELDLGENELTNCAGVAEMPSADAAGPWTHYCVRSFGRALDT